MNELVSVVIPTYNSSKHVKETIRSVQSQTYQNFEIILIDDGSIDDTTIVVENLSKKDPRIYFHQIDHSGRPSVPRNLGIQKSKGKYIAFLDSDDLWEKHKLEEQLKEFQRNPDLIFAYSMSVTFETSILSPQYEVLPLLGKEAHTGSDLISKGNSIPLSSVLAKKEALKKVNGFDEDPELQIEDYDLWIRLSELGSFIFIPRIHVYYRVHSSQFSADWETKKKRLEYLAKKRNLPLPSYRFARNKNIFLRTARNFAHFSTYLWISLLTFYRRMLH